MERRKKTPSLLNRDEHNQIIDKTQADKIAAELLRKLAVETRLHEKDQTMHMARTGRRDIVVHLAVTVLPRVNGITIAGEVEKEYNQWVIEFPARVLPIRQTKLHRAFANLAHTGMQALMKLGMVNA
jgi:hypothetical protein